MKEFQKNKKILGIKMFGIESNIFFITNDSKILISCLLEPSKNEASESILAIDNLLQKGKINFNEIDLIVVAYGVGSFTSNRIGVVLANTFSYSLGIPVFGIQVNTDLSQDDFLKKINNIDFNKVKLNLGKYVIPVYESEPNIICSASAKG